MRVRSLLLAGLTASLVAGAALLARSGADPADAPPDLRVAVEGRNPWTHLRLNTAPDQFQFVVVSDRTGGHRAGVFSRAVEQINLLQPQFVVSVGDLIEGYGAPDKAAAEWKEFQGYVSRLQMPFFFVPGNHDIASLPLSDLWKEKFGRRYYHFAYKDALFLCLNCFEGEPVERRGSNQKVYRTGFSPEQVKYVEKALAENPGAKWTFVFLHQPVWSERPAPAEGWTDIEKALGERPYTVFCGHVHTYRKYVRNGRNYYQLATTGGGSKLRGVPYGEFDQVAWVTMKPGGPVIANILLDGILPEDLKVPVTEEKGNIPGYGETVHPVRGTVHLDGAPLAGVGVTFTPAEEPAPGQRNYAAQGAVAGDGSFELTTFKPFDGAKADKYKVTFAPLRSPVDDGRPAKNPVPEKYRDVKTTPLEVEVKAGPRNEFKFELK